MYVIVEVNIVTLKQLPHTSLYLLERDANVCMFIFPVLYPLY